MTSFRLAAALAATLAAAAHAQETPLFRGGTTVVRVDAHVLNGKQPLAGLTQADFVVRDEGEVREIRYFATEEQSIDLLLLLDTSRSMGPQVSALVDAAHEALGVMRRGDRVGLMTFTRKSLLHLPLADDFAKVQRGMDEALRKEDFTGGTDIHAGLYDAAVYMAQNARPEARRVILIFTDDRTERARKDALVLRALWSADAVLGALVVETKQHGRTEAAGSEMLAGETGGESFKSAHPAQQLKPMLERLRKRYALNFNAPEELTPGARRAMTLELSPEARKKYPKAVVLARRGYVVPLAP